MADRSKKTTILKVAEAAGTSAMTVTRAFNNSGRIAPRTKARILKIAKQLDYKPDFFAKGMRGQRTKSIGMLMSMGAHEPLNTKIRMISSKLYEEGYSAYIADSFSDVKIIVKTLEEFIARKIDALFFQSAFRFLVEDAKIQRLLKEIPVVLIESYWKWDLPHDQIITDRASAMRKVMRRFRKSGRTKPIIAAPETSGVSEALKILKTEFSGQISTPGNKLLAKIDRERKLESFGQIYVEALQRTFPDLKGFDCIWCNTDEGAVAIIKHLTDNGVRVPEDVAVVGYGNTEICFYSNPLLASIDLQDIHTSRMEAWMLMDRLNAPDRPPMTELITMNLVNRESAG